MWGVDFVLVILYYHESATRYSVIAPRRYFFTALAVASLLTLAACAPVAYAPTDAEAPVAADSLAAAPDGTDAGDASLLGSVHIIEVFGQRSVRVGEEQNFRVRLAPGFQWPLQYTWDFGDGIISVGNNVTHRYARPGRYRLTVVTRNDVNSDTASVTITVTPAPVPTEPARPSEPVAAEAPFAPGDMVWVAGIYPEPDSARHWASVYTDAGLSAAVLPAYMGRGEAFLVAVGGYRTEAEAQRDRATVLRARDTPLWLLRLDERRGPR